MIHVGYYCVLMKTLWRNSNFAEVPAIKRTDLLTYQDIGSGFRS